jgi:hypothetical protein
MIPSSFGPVETDWGIALKPVGRNHYFALGDRLRKMPHSRLARSIDPFYRQGGFQCQIALQPFLIMMRRCCTIEPLRVAPQKPFPQEKV